MRATMCSVLLVLALVAAQSAGISARPVGAGWILEAVSALKEWTSGRLDSGASSLDTFADWLPGHGGNRGTTEEEDDKFVLLANFEVPPSIGRKFEKQWLKVKEGSEKEEGLIFLKFHRSLSNNKHWHVYQEWVSMDAWIKHLKNPGGRRLKEWIEEHNIGVQLMRLKHIAAHTAERKTTASHLQHKELPPADVIKFVVKPSQMDDFEDAAKQLTEAVASQEEENLVLAFAKAADSDYLAYVYAEWETREGIKKHLSAEHTQEFFDFLKTKDIFAKRSWWMPMAKEEG